jgi:hypothetical protein
VWVINGLLVRVIRESVSVRASEVLVTLSEDVRFVENISMRVRFVIIVEEFCDIVYEKFYTTRSYVWLPYLSASLLFPGWMND